MLLFNYEDILDNEIDKELLNYILNNLGKLRDNKIVILCRSKKIVDIMLKYMFHIYWYEAESLITWAYNNYETEKPICINISQMGYSNENWYISKGYEVIDFIDFIITSKLKLKTSNYILKNTRLSASD